MKVILGQKMGMSQVFSDDGSVVPVTLIWARPNHITLRRNDAKDGYAAVQLALPRKEGKVEKGEKKRTPGQDKKQYLVRREFPTEIGEDVKELTVEQFEPGDTVNVVGTSKGKGFQGVVKRHGFKGGPASHGHRHVLRAPGSIGAAFPQHVMKGMKMAGRMGADTVTVKNLEVITVDKEKNLLAVKGAVPGTRGSVLEIRSTNSKAQSTND